MIKVVTDSTCDLSAAVAAQLGITVVPMVVNVDGRDYMDGVDLSRDQFYAGLPSYREIPKTAANSPGILAEAYRAAKAQGATQIVSIHIARKVSGVCAAADIAANDAADDGIEVRVIDSGSMSLGLGWMAVTAAEMAQTGAGLDDIVRAVEAQRARTRILALIDTMKYLAKGGRVSALTAGVGELLQIKLLIELKEGVITPIDRIRTRGRGLDRMIAEARKTPSPLKLHSVLKTSGEQTKDLQTLAAALADMGPMQPQDSTLVTPIIGAHIGPMGVGVVLVGK